MIAIKRKETLLIVVCVVGCILMNGCNADAGVGSLLSLEANAKLEVLPEGADITAKTNAAHQAELEHGKPTIREIYFKKHRAKMRGLLEGKKSILARDNQDNQ